MDFWRHTRLLGIIITLVGLSIFSGCQELTENTLVSVVFPASEDEVGAFSWIGISFLEPMDSASVASSFSINPTINGQTFWEGNTFWFRPLEPLSLTTPYQAQLTGEFTTADGKTLTVDRSWQFTVRPPSLLYLKNGEIWRTNLNSEDPLQLSQSGGKVIEYQPEHSGKWIAYSLENELGGQDIWVMDRDGEIQRKLIDCGLDRCSEPDWAMDRTWIAYTRELYLIETGGYRPPQVWTVATATGETQQLYQTDNAYNQSPSFSPDGKKLATYDLTQNGIRLLDLETSQESLVPRNQPGTGDWSTDGRQILYTNASTAELEPFIDLYILNLESQEILFAFGEATTDTDFSQPRWTPDGEWIAVSLRPVNTNTNKALWVIRLKDDFAIPITEEPSANFSAYQWNPWGTKLVYQRFELTSTGQKSSIWLWDLETRRNQLVVEGAIQPKWLP